MFQFFVCRKAPSLSSLSISLLAMPIAISDIMCDLWYWCWKYACGWWWKTNLVETDVRGLLTEALTADVHLYARRPVSHYSSTPDIFRIAVDFSGGYPYPVLADQTGAVGADTAVLFQHTKSAHNFLSRFRFHVLHSVHFSLLSETPSQSHTSSLRGKIAEYAPRTGTLAEPIHHRSISNHTQI